jgi:16S rRNA (cytosine1402-N4)-methyltransferase
VEEVLKVLDPQPGQVVVDCTLGWAGHAVELLRRVGPTGLLIGLDLDKENLPGAKERLQTLGYPCHIHHANFAGLERILASHGLGGVHMVLADLGMSSMQVDDAERGFSYARDGALDMRMDRTRGRSAAQMLAEMPEEDLRRTLLELGDEPAAATIAKAIVTARQAAPIERTSRLVEIIQGAVGQREWRLHPRPGKWQSHPAMRTFQALRLLVNRELGNLGNLLRVLPHCLLPGGRAALISFHSGEDRLVKGALRAGLVTKVYESITKDAIRPIFAERRANPRSRSAKLRCARRAAGET